MSTVLTLEQLKKIMPKLNSRKADLYFPFLLASMIEFEINTPIRAASFLAQLAHESLELFYFEEIASGSAYEGRKNLGNTHPGDGVRYKGRGPIQLTGRDNYRKAGEALNLDLEGEPLQAVKPEVAFRVAGWFWQSHKLNEYADKGDFTTITRIINGGFNGLAQREIYFNRAKNVLIGGPQR